tara:strand:- start:147 stop:374 length:228 start_codon:yes stop_codon:yes gene_type:complete
MMSEPENYWAVYAEMTSVCKLVIKAKDRGEAWTIATKADGGYFYELPNSGDWNVYSVEQMREEDVNKEEVLENYV